MLLSFGTGFEVVSAVGKGEGRGLLTCFEADSGTQACSQLTCVLTQVPEKKLKLVMADKELYRACAVEVKRQIWQDNQALFGDEVSPLLKQYILEKESALFSTELSVLHNFFSPSPKTRRQGEVRQVAGLCVGWGD